ncbi:MAG: SDR family oxidoreductase [Pseudomonadota bacterium]
MLQNKTLLCMGGASGMGRGIAEAAIASGARVIVTSRSLDRAQSVAKELGCEGRAVDLMDADSVAELFSGLGQIDHLAVTAGAVGRSGFSNTLPEDARTFMDSKLWATHRCLLEARDHLCKDSSILLISGGYSREVTDEAGHVHIAFQAIEAMARVVAVSFAPIRCNVVRPGFIDSPLWNFMSDEERQQLRNDEKQKSLLGSIVSSRQFGEAVIRIMTSQAITGATIPVDAGRHLSNG